MTALLMVLSGIISLIVGIVVGLSLDKIRKRVKMREDRKTILEAFLCELVSNYRKLRESQPVELRATEKALEQGILTAVEKKSVRSLRKLLTSYNEKLAQGNKINTLDLQREVLNMYSQPFLPNGISVGIIRCPSFKRPTRGGCGHWGIAPPNFYMEKLRNFSCRYISHLYENISQYQIVINPYGEALPLKDSERSTVVEYISLIKKFLLEGGVWVHAGGYPFWAVYDVSEKQQEDLFEYAKEQFALAFKGHGGPLDIQLTEEAESILGNFNLYANSFRVCTNPELVWGKVKEEAVLGFKRVGKGGIVFYGAMHSKLQAQEQEAGQLLIRVINWICLQALVETLAP